MFGVLPLRRVFEPLLMVPHSFVHPCCLPESVSQVYLPKGEIQEHTFNLYPTCLKCYHISVTPFGSGPGAKAGDAGGSDADTFDGRLGGGGLP